MHRFAILYLFILVNSFHASATETDPYEICPSKGTWIDFGCHPHPGECYFLCRRGLRCVVADEAKCGAIGPKPTACYCQPTFPFEENES